MRVYTNNNPEGQANLLLQGRWLQKGMLRGKYIVWFFVLFFQQTLWWQAMSGEWYKREAHNGVWQVFFCFIIHAIQAIFTPLCVCLREGAVNKCGRVKSTVQQKYSVIIFYILRRRGEREVTTCDIMLGLTSEYLLLTISNESVLLLQHAAFLEQNRCQRRCCFLRGEEI